MTLTRRDGYATLLTALVVLAFVTTSASWNVPLIGSSHRLAAIAIALLGVLTCALGSAGDELARGARMSGATKVLAVVGTATVAVTAWAILTGSPTAVALLTACIVALWAGSTLRHAWRPTHRPIAT